ncbi:MAG: hypothetical protein V7760_14430 [Marinobacter sp.]|jgi:hypothetical protein
MTSEKAPGSSVRSVFMDELVAQGYSQVELDHLTGLWPEAERVTNDLVGQIPPVGWFSLHKPFMAFVTVCRALDRLQAERGLSDEQVQLALAILRLRSAPYCKAERVFLARVHRLNKDDYAGLPTSVREFLLAVGRLASLG